MIRNTRGRLILHCDHAGCAHSIEAHHLVLPVETDPAGIICYLRGLAHSCGWTSKVGSAAVEPLSDYCPDHSPKGKS